jgi:hypothetical protein
MWILWRYRNPASWIFVVFNSFIHTLMYGYYAASIRGVKGLGAIKWLMTFLQILQLFIGTAISFWYPIYQDSFRESWTLMAGFCISTFYTGSLIVLFVEFFISRFEVDGFEAHGIIISQIVTSCLRRKRRRKRERRLQTKRRRLPRKERDKVCFVTRVNEKNRSITRGACARAPFSKQ